MPLSEHVYCVVVIFKMTEQVEQQIRIKFCIRLEHSSMETIWMMLKAFGDYAVSVAQSFKDGQGSVESDPHSGRPATSKTPENVECVWAAINKD